MRPGPACRATYSRIDACEEPRYVASGDTSSRSWPCGTSMSRRPTASAGRLSDERLACAVHDVAARRRHGDGAQPVVVGRGHVLRAGEDLQEPEAEEDDGEDDHGHGREAGDAQAERRQLGDRPVAAAGAQHAVRHLAEQTGAVRPARRRRRRPHRHALEVRRRALPALTPVAHCPSPPSARAAPGGSPARPAAC